VAARRGLDGVVDGKARVVAPVVHGQLLAARVHGVLPGAPADAFGSLPDPVGQDIPDALPPDHLLEKCRHGRRVSPRQLEAVRVRFREDPPFPALHRKGDRAPRGDRVHPGPVQHLVHVENAVEIRIHALPAQREDRLVLGLVRLAPPGFRNADAAAAQGAGITVVLRRFDGLDVVGVEGSGPAHAPVGARALPVHHGGVSHLDGHLVHARRAPLPEEDLVEHAVEGHLGGKDAHESAEIRHGPAGEKGRLELDPPVAGAAQALHGRRVVDRDAQLAVEDHRLETLGAHDGAQPRSGGHAAPVVADARDEREALAGGSDDGRAGPGAVLGKEHPLRLDGVLPPQAGGVAQLGPAVLHVQVDGGPARPAEEDAVEAVPLDGGRQAPAAVGVSPGPGQGGLPDGAPAAREVAGGCRQEPRDEPQDVVGTERIGTCRDALVEEPGGKPRAGEVFPANPVRDRFWPNLARREIHVEDLPHAGEGHARTFLPFSRHGRC